MTSLYELEQLELGLIGGIAYSAIPNFTTVTQGEVINRSLLLQLTKYLVENNYENIEQSISLYNQVFIQNNSNNARIEALKSKIKDLYFKMKNAQNVTSKLPSYINQLNLDLTDSTLFDPSNTTALISDKIVGVSTSLARSTDYTNLTLSLFSASDLSVNLVDSMGITTGYINAPNINTGNSFTIGAETPYFIDSRRFELIIDRKNKEQINQIDLSLNESHIIKIQSSSDNNIFTDIVNTQLYVKSSIIPIEPNIDRYLKIVFYKNSDLKSTLRNGKYTYKVVINHLYLTGITIADESQFETNNIDLGAVGINGISLDTCDNYQDPNVDISYFIDFNDENNWKEIRPIGKVRNDKASISSFIRLNDYYTNKIIEIKDQPIYGSVSNPNGLSYPLTTDSNFVSSNQLRIFNRVIPTDYPNWNKVNGQYATTGVLNTGKTLNLGSTYPLYINGVAQMGIVTLDPGIYTLALDPVAYLYLFDPSQYTIISVSDTGLYTLKLILDSTIVTIQDTMYPYNIKSIVETNFDFLFYQELIENEDYTLYNNGTTYYINTKAPYYKLYVLYRLFSSNGTGVTAKIKGTYQSLNNITIPFTERITIRYI